MTAQKKCTLGPKHKWLWVKDRTLYSSMMSDIVRITRKGIYRCKCGAAKYGAPHSGL